MVQVTSLLMWPMLQVGRGSRFLPYIIYERPHSIERKNILFCMKNAIIIHSFKSCECKIVCKTCSAYGRNFQYRTDVAFYYETIALVGKTSGSEEMKRRESRVSGLHSDVCTYIHSSTCSLVVKKIHVAQNRWRDSLICSESLNHVITW